MFEFTNLLCIGFLPAFISLSISNCLTALALRISPFYRRVYCFIPSKGCKGANITKNKAMEKTYILHESLGYGRIIESDKKSMQVCFLDENRKTFLIKTIENNPPKEGFIFEDKIYGYTRMGVKFELKTAFLREYKTRVI